MPTPTTVRRIIPAQHRNFGRIHDEFPVPDLTEIQTRSYERFLQADSRRETRRLGLEGVFREIFPIESYDKTLKLEYISYDLGKPRYDPDECRQLRLTYGRPLHVWLRLNKGETAIEESVYLGDMPIMIGGGEFIINGAERVVVSQLHRSPGVDFVVEIESGDKKLHACRVIPERGSWIELQVTKKETLGVRIDQSGKFSAMTLLRAMSPAVLVRRGDPQGVLRGRRDRHGRPQGGRQARGPDRLRRRHRPEHRRSPVESGATISKALGEVLADAADLGRSAVLKEASDPLILQSLQEDPTRPRERLAADLPAAPPGQPAPAREGTRAVPGEVLRRQPLSPRQGRPLPDQPEVRPERPRRPDDAPTRSTTSTRSATSSAAQGQGATSTTSTTWATAGSARSTSWPPTSCARASSS